MKKFTLLEMVQNIASALETDEVNSITDTTESLQIAEVIRETFYELFTNTDVPDLTGMIKLDSVSSIASPNYLRIPDTVNKVFWLRYKDYVSEQYFPLKYVPPKDFLDTILAYSSIAPSSNLTETIDPDSGISYCVRNDGPPSEYTIFGDNYVAFNSYELAFETTMQGDNSIGYGQKNVEFELEDDFVPPVDANLFPLLLAEAKSVCFINLKQVSSAKEEQRSRRQKRKIQREKHKSRSARNEEWTRRNNFARNR